MRRGRPTHGAIQMSNDKEVESAKELPLSSWEDGPADMDLGRRRAQ
jgi:hypothetical protein